MNFIDKFLEKLKIDRHKKMVYANFVTKWVKIIFRTMFILGMAYVLLYPILYLLSNSFAGPADRFNPTVIWIPINYTLDSIKGAIVALDYWASVGRTLVILIPTVTIQLIICLLVGYGFARFKFKGRETLFGLLLFTIIVPAQTMIIPLYVNYSLFWGIGPMMFPDYNSQMSLLNTPWTFYLSTLFGMGIRSGLYIFIFRQFFRGMPKELEEAALIDGCGPLSVFRKIMVPNASASMITVVLFSVVWHWNEYYLSSLFYDSEFPISVTLSMIGSKISNITSMGGADLDLLRNHIVESGALLVLAPILIVYIFTQKYFTESIERTGLVG